MPSTERFLLPSLKVKVISRVAQDGLFRSFIIRGWGQETGYPLPVYACSYVKFYHFLFFSSTFLLSCIFFFSFFIFHLVLLFRRSYYPPLYTFLRPSHPFLFILSLFSMLFILSSSVSLFTPLLFILSSLYLASSLNLF